MMGNFEITSYCISGGLDAPLKALIVADLHSAPTEELYAAIREISPDLILCPGDTFHRATPDTKGIEFLNNAAKLCPVFCSVGNHEVKHGTGARAAIRQSGAVLLDDEWTEFGGITIGGLSTGYVEGLKQGRLKKTPRPRLEALEGFFAKDGFKILLSHHPEYYPRYLKDKNVGLIISGHAHGGQWRMFGRGVFAPGQGIFPKYTAGLHDGKLLVSRGLANNTAIPRIFNKPELIILNLK